MNADSKISICTPHPKTKTEATFVKTLRKKIIDADITPAIPIDKFKPLILSVTPSREKFTVHQQQLI